MNHQGQLRVAEVQHAAKHIAVKRLIPQIRLGRKIPAQQHGFQLRVDRGCIQSKMSPLSIAQEANRHLRVEVSQPPTRCQNLLNLKTDQMPPHLECGAIDKLPAGQIGSPISLGQITMNEGGEHDAEPLLCKPGSKPGLNLPLASETDPVLRPIIRIRQSDHLPPDFVCRWLDEYSLSMKVTESRPSDVPRLPPRARGDLIRITNGTQKSRSRNSRGFIN